MLRKDRPLVAVVGAGYWGKNLVRNFYRLGAVKSLYDQSSAAVRAMLEAHPGLSAASSYQDILDDPEVRGVVLATPAVTHYDLARRALNADKHVFVEKPLALAKEEGRALVELAENRGLILMVDHLLQRHPAYEKLRSMTAEGFFGRIRHIHSRRLSFGKIRCEEDVWWSFAPHDISMILGLMGRAPLSVAAVGEYWLNLQTADRAEARLDFGGGVSAQISVGWLNPVKEHRLTLVGEEKMAVFDDSLPWPEKLITYDHRVDWPDQKPLAVKAEGLAVELTEGEPLAAQARDFLAAMSQPGQCAAVAVVIDEQLRPGGGFNSHRAMEGRSRPLSCGREGLAVLSVLEAGAESMKMEGRPVIVKPQSGQCAAEAAVVNEQSRPGSGFNSRPTGETGSKYFVHPTAVIDEGARIGDGCRIWHFSHILGETELGENCNLGQNVVVGPRVKIGRGVKIQNNVSVYEGVSLEDEVFCGPSMVFTNVDNPRSAVVRKHEYRPTVVRRGASIGANATVVCGHTLGSWCFIGAGAVVCKDVPAHALMVGNPARRIGWMCRCGRKLAETLACPDCGLTYRETEAGLEAVNKD